MNLAKIDTNETTDKGDSSFYDSFNTMMKPKNNTKRGIYYDQPNYWIEVTSNVHSNSSKQLQINNKEDEVSL